MLRHKREAVTEAVNREAIGGGDIVLQNIKIHNGPG